MRKYEKRLVILTPGFPKDETDTLCLPFLQDFIIELNEQFPKLKIDILAFDYPLNANTYQWNKNEVISFNGWKKGYIKRLYKWFQIWRMMNKIKSGRNIIGLLSLWCGECAYLGNRFAKRNHLTHFCWIQGQDAKKSNKYIARIKPVGAELIAISDFNQEEFEKNHGLRPGHVIPVGIRPPGILNGDKLKDIDILGVGSLIPLKQYHLFIEIIYKIKQSFPLIKAVLCGKGPDEERLKMAIVNYKLQGNIELTGELSHDKIMALMKRGKVFIHPSNYEGFSVACLEALGSGCHVISFIQPMQYDIEQWHIVQTLSEMVETAKSILNNPIAIYKPVLPFNVKECVKSILQLYNHNDSIIP
ncbi:MAG TPA: glycosyltransferase family 4 protein [Nitrosopumilaceae archaeon]|jgi:glycosyltransferase involved in cell wall biosynthesis|nr:glycosyltransferase family 4 protein [Nitrosopumilaceae archaeon]